MKPVCWKSEVGFATLLFLGLGIAAIGPALAAAADGPSLHGEGPEMRFSGQYLEFSDAERVAVIKEGGYVQFQELKLWAENIHIDLVQNVLHAEGDVILWRGTERFALETLSYNYKTHRGRARGLKTHRGPVLISSRTILFEPQRILGYTVVTTTDQSPDPGYRIEAEKMVMLPREKITFHKAHFKVGDTTYFTLPTYMVNLEHPERVNRLSVSPAYDGTRGFNLRTFWDYYFSDSNYGRFYFNPSQFEGTNIGLSHQYELSERGRGNFEYTKFQSSTLGQRNTRYNLHHDQTLPWGAQANFNTLFSQNTFDATGIQRKLAVNSAVNQSVGDYQTGVTVDRLFDLDNGLNPSADLTQYLNTTPRVFVSQMRPHEVFGNLLSYRLDGSLAQIEERTVDGASPLVFDPNNPNAVLLAQDIPTEIEATKGELNLNFFPRPFELGDVSRVNWNFRTSQNAYSTGEIRNILFANMSTREQWSDNFSTAFDYSFQNVAGDSPFRSYDSFQLDQNLLTGYVRANSDDQEYNATLFQSTYDLYDGGWRNAASNFVVRSHSPFERSWALSLTPIYGFNDATDFGSIKMDTLASNLRTSDGDRWAHALITNYDFDQARVTSVASAFDVLLSDTVRAEIYSNHSYSLAMDKLDLTKLNVAITKDLNAFEARLRWNTIQQEVFLEFYLKFASQKKLNLGLRYEDTVQFISPNQARGGGF